MRLLRAALAGLACFVQAGSALAASPSLVGLPQSSDPTCNAGEYYLAVLTTGSKWRKCENGTWSDIGATAGSGEANTASNLGGGLANYDSKSGVDLRFNSFNSAHFDLASNVISVDEPGLESLLDLADLSGLLPLSKLTDDGTAGKCLMSGGGGSDPAYGTCPGAASGSGDFLANGSVPMTGDLDLAGHDLVDPDAVGADIYYVDSVAEAQTALTRCGSDITGSTQSGCIVQFTGGLFDNGGTTLHLAGDGTAATGRAGVILRGVGGGTAAGDAGNPNSGTIIKASGAVPIIDVGACMGCMIENITLAGEDVATVGIDFLAPASTPTTRFVIRNVAMYEIDGYGIRTATTGQVDTSTFESVSVRDSDGCYQQRYTQNVGIVLDAFDCSRLTGTGPAFDIQSGDLVFREGFLSLKTFDNAVGFSFGVATGPAEIRGSQIEIVSKTGITIIDDDQGGAQTNEIGTKIFDANHVVFDQSGNTLIDAWRRGHWIVTNNVIDNNDGGTDHTIATAFDRDTTTSGSRLIVTYAGNVSRNVDSGQSTRPEIWTPTTGSDVLVRTDVRFGADAPVVCKDGETFIETDLATGATLKICTAANTWTSYASLIGTSELPSALATDAEVAAGYQPLATSLTRLVSNCTIEDDATPIPDSSVGDVADAGGGGGSLPVTDTSSIAEGSSDATKEVRFEVDGISTGTVRVLTMPDFNVDLGAIADASVSDTLTASIFKGSGTTTNAVDLATAEVSGLLPVANAGTGSAPSTDDQVLVSSSSTAAAWKTLPDSDGATQKLQYDWSTNSFLASTDDDVPESGDFGNATDLTSAGAVNSNAVALSTDTTGNYVATVADSGSGDVVVSGSGSEGAAVTLGLSSDVTRDSELAKYTVGTSAPVDGTTACTNGDMYLDESANKVYFCVDSATDDWFGVALTDTP